MNTLTAMPSSAALTGSVSFKLEPTVARRIGAGGWCGASKTNTTNMLDMPSMKDETVRMTTTPEIRINTTVPEPILRALAGARLHYSAFEHVFHCIYLGDQRWIGVAGDGDNGCYEWFVFNGADDGPTRMQDKLTHSDCGFGSTDWALKEIVNKEVR